MITWAKVLRRLGWEIYVCLPGGFKVLVRTKDRDKFEEAMK